MDDQYGISALVEVEVPDVEVEVDVPADVDVPEVEPELLEVPDVVAVKAPS